VSEYETQISLQADEIKSLRFHLKKELDREKELIAENDRLAEDLEVKHREYFKLLSETRDNADLLTLLGDSSKQSENGESYKMLKERIHMLTEENHILFEQVTLLRVHHDAVTKECADKMAEAQSKIR
jgi:hypothetical protein